MFQSLLRWIGLVNDRPETDIRITIGFQSLLRWIGLVTVTQR